MTDKKAVFGCVRPWLDAQGFTPARVAALDAAIDGVAPVAVPTFGEFIAKITNKNAPALTDADFQTAALALGVDVKIVRAVRKVEAPRGPFDDEGRPSILYERHAFARNTTPKGAFNASHPDISGPGYGPGGYGSFAQQYARLGAAYALDPMAAIEACSWGAFQVLGENWQALGYASPLDMAMRLAESEAAHLDSFVRFVTANHLIDELQHCKPGDPESWVPFVAIYNGPGFRRFNYHLKASEAAR